MHRSTQDMRGQRRRRQRMDAGLRLRLERGLLEQFMAACRADGRIAAQVLRTMIRDYVTQSRDGHATAED